MSERRSKENQKSATAWSRKVSSSFNSRIVIDTSVNSSYKKKGMKITVRFKGVPFVIPCEDGDISIRTLIDRALQRYKKFQGFNDNVHLEVSKIVQERYNGILDLDDRVIDVLEDKETSSILFNGEVICHIKETPVSHFQELRDTPDVVPSRYHHHPQQESYLTGTLHMEMMEAHAPKSTAGGMSRLFTKRSDSPHLQPSSDSANNGFHSLDRRLPSTLKVPNSNGSNSFARNSALRRSLGGAEVVEKHSSSALGSFDKSPSDDRLNIHHDLSQMTTCRVCLRPKSLMLADFHLKKNIDNKENRLWLFKQIKLLPCFDPVSSHLIGLEVDGLTETAPKSLKALLAPGDVILKINGASLEENCYFKCLSLFEEAFYHDDIRLDLKRHLTNDRRILPLSSPSSPSSPTSPMPPALPPRKRTTKEPSSGGPTSPMQPHSPIHHHSSKTTTADPNQRPVAVLPKAETINKDMNVNNVRTIGKQCSITLKKPLQHGFGLTLTTRDVDVTGEGKKPVYIKKILSHGAAIADGRLKVGDRLLSLQVANKTVQDSESLGPSGISPFLKQLPPLTEVTFVISRQVTEGEGEQAVVSPNHQHSGQTMEKATNSSQLLTVYIPLLSRDEPLGMDARWDVGPNRKESVYICSLTPNSASAREGSLKAGDQIIQLNNVKIDGIPDKTVAFNCLRGALQDQRLNGDMLVRLIVRRSTASVNFDIPTSTSHRVSNSTNNNGLHSRPRPKSALLEPSSHYLLQDNSDSDEDSFAPSAMAFIREGVGRRSMSEKRAAMEDPSRFHFYNQLKASRNNNNEPDASEQMQSYSTLPTMGRMQKLQNRAARKKKQEQSMQESQLEAGNSAVHNPHRPVLANHSIQPQLPPKENREWKETPNMYFRGVNNIIPIPPRKSSQQVLSSSSYDSNAVRPSSADSNTRVAHDATTTPIAVSSTNGNSGLNTPNLRRGGLRNNSFRKATDKSVGLQPPGPMKEPPLPSREKPRLPEKATDLKYQGHSTVSTTTAAPVPFYRRNSDHGFPVVTNGHSPSHSRKDSLQGSNESEKKSHSKNHKNGGGSSSGGGGLSQIISLFKRNSAKNDHDTKQSHTRPRGGEAAISAPIMNAPHDLMPDTRLVDRISRFPVGPATTHSASTTQGSWGQHHYPTASSGPDSSTRNVTSPNLEARRPMDLSTHSNKAFANNHYPPGHDSSGLPRRQDSLHSHHSAEESAHHNRRRGQQVPQDSKQFSANFYPTNEREDRNFTSPQMPRSILSHQRRSSATGKVEEKPIVYSRSKPPNKAPDVMASPLLQIRHYRPPNSTEDSIYATVHRTKF